MNVNIIFKETKDFTVQEKQQFIDLFFHVFGKRIDQTLFDRKFLCTPKGYSYHGLMLDQGVIVGTFNAIPYRYKYFGKELVFGLSVDTMIHSEYRGGGHLVDMANYVYEALVRDGIPFILGFPNEYFYKHEKRILGTKDIGELEYYILPRNIGAVMPKLKLLNFCSRIYSIVITRLSKTTNNTEHKYSIERIVDEESEKQRYDESYTKITLGHEAACFYKICEENNRIQALYIVDVFPLTPALLTEAVKHIYRIDADSIDLILYVGVLPFKPAGLFKVPHSKKPQRIRMTGKILMPKMVDDSVFTIDNWRVNISNFDVR